MNEIDLTTKIEGLKKAIKEHDDFSATYQNDLAKVEKQLKDYNKPAITPAVMDEIQEAIEKAVEDFDFSDDDNFETEFEMDYDNKVRLSNIEFKNSYDLVEMIAEKVLDLFQEAECSEDEKPIAENCESEVTTDNPVEEEKPKKRLW